MTDRIFAPSPDETALSGRPTRSTVNRGAAVVGVAALGVLGLFGGVWLMRIPIAAWAIGETLDARGVTHRFSVERVDFTGITLTDLALGDESAPDVAAARISAAWTWRPAPSLEAVSAEGLSVKGALTETGLSWGALDALVTPEPGAVAAPPPIQVTLRDTRVTIDTLFGVVRASGDGDGRLGDDFNFAASLIGPKGLSGAATIRAMANGWRAKATVAAPRLVRDRLDLEGVTAEGDAQLGYAGELAGLTIRAGATAARLDGLAATDVAFSAAGGQTGDWTAAVARADLGGAQIERLDVTGKWTAALDGGVSVQGRLTQAAGANRVRLSAATRSAFVGLAAPQDTPFAAPLAEIRGAFLTAAESMSAQGGFAYTSANGGRLDIDTLQLDSRSGARLTVRPGENGFRFEGPSFTPTGGVRAVLAGGGFPTIDANIEAEGDALRGRMAVAPITARDSTLAIDVRDLRFNMRTGAFTLDAKARASGPLAGGRLDDMTAPLQLAGTLTSGFAIAPQQSCLTVTARRLTAAGGVFDNLSLPICPVGGDFLRVSPSGTMSGGARIAGRRFPGVLSETGAPATLAFNGASLTFQGRTASAELLAPQFNARLAGGDLIAQADRADVVLSADGARGAVRGGRVDGTAFPVTIAMAQIDFATDGDAMRLVNGRALVLDRPPLDADGAQTRARFNPLALEDVAGRLDNGVLTSTGAVVLVGNAAPGAQPRPSRRLGAFRAAHNVIDGEGSAVVETGRLTFEPGFDALDISDPIRGVASDVAGVIEANLDVSWKGGALAANGDLKLDAISFNTAALGRVENISGEMRFDDLLALRSQASQTFTIGRVDPGVGVIDGTVKLQVLGPTSVRLEQARWPLGAGALEIAPQTLDLSTRNFDLTLTLTEVDLSDLIKTLGLPDLEATGAVTGSFPIKFSEDGARVENGRLSSSPGGGVLRYTGSVGEVQEGPQAIAFEALKGFKYDRLDLTLNGDLAGVLTSRIAFEGVNTEPVRNLGSLLPNSGVSISDDQAFPFQFNIAVTAPFREMLAGYQCVTDTYGLTQQAADELRGVRRDNPACRTTVETGNPPAVQR